MAFAKQIEPAIRQAVPCKRVGVAVIGLEVPHAHVHLIPMKSMNDMNFNHKLKLSQEELAETAAKIRSFLN
jgi:histidine triad (HIT) family protein